MPPQVVFQRGLVERPPARLVHDDLPWPHLLGSPPEKLGRIERERAWALNNPRRQLRAARSGCEDLRSRFDRGPATEVDIAPVSAIQADDVDDRPAGVSEDRRERRDLRHGPRGSWDL